MTFSGLAQLSDENLHVQVKRLVGRANTLAAELLAHLAEVEARGIHRERACSSYTYCVYELCMSEDEAQRRCRAARLARQFPVLLQMLAEASIHLTGILLIGPHLTPENQSELLARVRFRTKREIERIVAEIAPAFELPPRIELLRGEQASSIEELDAAPARQRNTWAAYVRALAGPVRSRSAGIGAGEAPPIAARESCIDLTAQTGEQAPLRELPEKPAHGPAENRGARYRIQFSADQAYLDLLEEARELLQHVLPDRDLVEVQRRALQALVKGLRARKQGATERPRATRSTAPERKAAPEREAAKHDAAPKSRPAPERRPCLPAQVRRTVWQRDGGRCAYTDSRGQRCRERSGLEFHHQQPHARGGPATLDNLELRCRAHNALAAEYDFGRERIRERRQRGAEMGSPAAFS